MESVINWLAGKKTHLLVGLMILLNIVNDTNTYGGIDVDTLETSVKFGLVSTIKAWVTRLMAK